jgi:hypothetical protein
MLFEWTPNFIPNKIFVFGCGGTGSRVVPLLAQFIKSCPWVPNPEMYIFDFDIVEEKNLLRQNFISSDINKNKASILANRYSKAFNINITPLTEKFSKKCTDFGGIYNRVANLISSQNRANNLFILCVDTPEARRDIVSSILVNTYNSHHNMIIDAGNENDFGQVTLSSSTGLEPCTMLDNLKDNSPIKCPISFIPLDPKYYDNMEATSSRSCAELDQTMAINSLMAVNILAVVQNLYYVKPMSFFRINISLQHGAVPQYINATYLKDCFSASPVKTPTVLPVVQRLSLKKAFNIAYNDQCDIEAAMLPPITLVAEPILEGEPKKSPRKKVGTTAVEELVQVVQAMGSLGITSGHVVTAGAD